MKKIIQMLSSGILGIMLMVSVTVFASDNILEAGLSESEQLKVDFEIINNVPSDQQEEFIENNQEWIRDVEVRLESYLSDIPKEEQEAAILILLGGDPTQRNNGNYYFNSHRFHMRNGYNTYSMDPTLTTRLFRPNMEAGWAFLQREYRGTFISNDDNRLWNQYLCHWDLLVERVWDIEWERPRAVDYGTTITNLCNP